MKKVYPVIFTVTNDEKDTVLIEVPDWSILTEGFGMADAIHMARDAIGLKAIYYEDKEMAIPEPRWIYDIDLSKGTFVKDGRNCVSLVDIDFAEYRKKSDNKSVRRNVTIPYWLNQEAEKANINVSKVLQNALMEVLGVKNPRN